MLGTKGALRVFGMIAWLAAAGLWIASPAPAAEGRSHTNSIGMEFVLIPAGTFMMGCEDGNTVCEAHEKPGHEVVISRPFYMGRHEVTRGQWEAVMGRLPGGSGRGGGGRSGDRNAPAAGISWEDAHAFVQQLNRKEGHLGYRLPTEAEWEYAARAGSATPHFFANPAWLNRYAWNSANAGGGPRPVGKKNANPWGLHDVYGNVWEWVADWYAENYYAASARRDPVGPPGGVYRVLRGGAWNSGPASCRSAERLLFRPERRDPAFGFRIVLVPGR